MIIFLLEIALDMSAFYKLMLYKYCCTILSCKNFKLHNFIFWFIWAEIRSKLWRLITKRSYVWIFIWIGIKDIIDCWNKCWNTTCLFYFVFSLVCFKKWKHLFYSLWYFVILLFCWFTFNFQFLKMASKLQNIPCNG